MDGKKSPNRVLGRMRRLKLGRGERLSHTERGRAGRGKNTEKGKGVPSNYSKKERRDRGYVVVIERGPECSKMSEEDCNRKEEHNSKEREGDATI